MSHGELGDMPLAGIATSRGWQADDPSREGELLTVVLPAELSPELQVMHAFEQMLNRFGPLVDDSGRSRVAVWLNHRFAAGWAPDADRKFRGVAR